MTTIDGEALPVEAHDTALARPAEVSPVPVFNPLDTEPVAFQRMLTSRKENYDALAMHLRGMLVPDQDFGRIHIERNCQEGKWRCTDRRHWSDHQLFAAGADKILAMLGLGVEYPNTQDYMRAALKGMPINDVIATAQIVDHKQQVIAEGMGACSRDEAMIKGDLNRCIKRACKRARVEATKRLPGISALFEADFLATVADRAAKNGGNTTTSRSRQVNQSWNTGVELDVMPIGKKLKGTRFDDMSDSQLDWIASNFDDKPDIRAAALRIIDRRRNISTDVNRSKSGAGGADQVPPDHAGGRPKQADQANDAPPAEGPPEQSDWWEAYENTPEFDR